MRIGGIGNINSPVQFDPWVVVQFQAFTGMSWAQGTAAAVGNLGTDAGVIQINGGLVSAPVGSAAIGSGVGVGTGASAGSSSGSGSTSAPGTDAASGAAMDGGCGYGGGTLNLPPLPSATTAIMPSMTRTAASGQPGTQTAVTSQWLTDRLPNIVNNTPMTAGAACPNTFANWINQNSTLVLLGLAGVTFWMLHCAREKGGA